MVFFIRSASDRDIAALGELLAASWRVTYPPLIGADKTEALIAQWHTPEKIAANIALPNGEYLVADDGVHIGGMAFASMSGEGDRPAVKLHQLYVHPDCQRQGVGRDLFADIETCFPGARRLIIEVEPGNAQAISFYEGVGMRAIGQTGNCGGDSDVPALIMEKQLAAEV